MQRLIITDSRYLPAAEVEGATARSRWDISAATDNPTPAIVSGSNQRYAVLDFTDAQASVARRQVLLPSDFYPLGGLVARILWSTPAVSPLQARWTCETAFALPNDDAAYGALDPAFNALQAVVSIASVDAAFPLVSVDSPSLTLEFPDTIPLDASMQPWLFLRIGRTPAHASDTLADTASLIGVELRYQRWVRVGT